ncbi:MAG: hypothetical protein ACRES3_10255 [Steroidobacteraceae bacterium]
MCDRTIAVNTVINMLTILRKWIYDLLAAIIVSLVALPAHAALEGNFQQGLYTAPGQLFTVTSPLGPEPILVDSFDRSTGAVTFLDETGQLYGIVCTPNLDILAGADNDFETNAAILRNWLREATLPMFFERMMPGSSILREEPAEFEGQPAWIAIIHMPQGSPMIRNDPATGYPTRQDSWRGVVIFSRGGQTYLLMTEAASDIPGAMRQFDASAPDWNAFLSPLAQFYRSMTFQAMPPETPETPQPEGQHAGT